MWLQRPRASLWPRADHCADGQHVDQAGGPRFCRVPPPPGRRGGKVPSSRRDDGVGRPRRCNGLDSGCERGGALPPRAQTSAPRSPTTARTHRYLCPAQNIVKDSAKKPYGPGDRSWNYCYVVGEARSDLSVIWFAPNSDTATEKLKPNIRAVTQFKSAVATLGTAMGSNLALLRVADVLQQVKQMVQTDELRPPFLSIEKGKPSEAYPPLRMHFVANVAKQRGAVSPSTQPCPGSPTHPLAHPVDS